MQNLMTHIALMPKPTGGERPIGLNAMCHRLAVRLRKVMVASWDQKFCGFWDDAIRGSSPLKAAILRALRVEVSKLLGMDAIGLLWDLAAFFDSIDIAPLIPMALEQEYCPWILAMALKVHMGCRAFKEGKFVSSWIESSGTSLVAGCLTSCGLTKPSLYDMLDELHRECAPVTIRTWIDDCFQLHTGAKQVIGPHAKRTALRFVELATARRLSISNKSTITSSDQALAEQLQKDLAEHGVQVQVEDSRLGQSPGGRLLRRGQKACPSAAGQASQNKASWQASLPAE